MKKFLKKAAVVLLAAVFLTGMYTPVFAAETSKVVVHVQDGASWGSMNIYNWGDDGETAGVWPGTAMTAEGDDWYTYTLETKCDLNLVFSAKAGKPQSGNIDKVTPDAGEIWVVIGGQGETNDMGADTVAAKLYTAPEAGWPSVAANDDAEDAAVTEDTTAADTTEDAAATTDTTADTTDTTAADTTSAPKTGESQTLAITFLGLAALSAAAFVVLKKKERTSEN